ncbi:MAG: hypothetical protein V3T14_04490 [Myxococcota bacterium]
MGIGLRLPLGLACLLPMLACARIQISDLPRRPAATEEVVVSDRSELGGYVVATLTGSRDAIRFYFPSDSGCDLLLRDGATLTWGQLGLLGNVTGPEGRCEPVGRESMGRWRDSRSRPRTRGNPRAVAQFEVVHESSTRLLLRGRFPLVTLVGWVGDDVIAVLPVRPECQDLLTRREAFMEYRSSGPRVFDLTGTGPRCEITGLIQPIRR